jgi:osmotically-inducible protein OsmY
MAQVYRCTNFSTCNTALDRKDIEVPDGDPLLCPDCEKDLAALPKAKPLDWKRLVLFAGLAAAIALGSVGFVISRRGALPASSPHIADKEQGPRVQDAAKSIANTVSPALPAAPVCGDRELAVAIHNRYEHDEDLAKEPIQVDVARNTVVLSGTVSSDLARSSAEALARDSGCTISSIVDNLRVDKPDAAIAKEIRGVFAGEPTLRVQHLQVDVSRGNVVLSGAVPENLMRTSAANFASQVAGVKTIINNIRIAAPPQLPPPHDPVAELKTLAPPSGDLSGTWAGTFHTCAQGQTDVRIQFSGKAPDDIVASVEITMSNQHPGTFTTHGVLNTLNSFLTLQFSGWEYQPPGLVMGNVGGLVTYVDQRPAGFAGVVRSPGCGSINVKRL